MLHALRAFLTHPAPTKAQAAGALRTLFLLAFGGQTVLALLAWGVLALVFRPEPAGTALTAQVLLVLGALLLPVTLLLSHFSKGTGERSGALSATLLEGIVLASPVWFALFVWLIGSPLLYLALLLGLAALYYGLGLLLTGRHAQHALVVKPPELNENASNK